MAVGIGGLRLIHNMPINHIAGVGMMGLYPIIVGGTLVFQDRFDPKDMLRLIEEERITFWLQAPTNVPARCLPSAIRRF